MRHVLTVFDLTAEEIQHLFAETAHLKAAHQRRIYTPMLMGRVLALVFEKPSLRTRVSFEAGVAQLGGSSLFQAGNEVGLGVVPATELGRRFRDLLGAVNRVFAARADSTLFVFAGQPVRLEAIWVEEILG